MALQLALGFDDRTQTLVEIHRRLEQRFGPQADFVRLDPISQLVLSLIGGRTRSEVSKQTFEALLARFERWEVVRHAPVAALHETIRPVTFGEVKAMHLKATLTTITDADGDLSLDGLAQLSVPDAMAQLERLPGVGRKVAAATLNFSTLRMRTLVIDTHHLRVLRRLRLVDAKTTPADAYNRIMPLLPSEWSAEDLTSHHHLMKVHGQVICRFRRPICRHCPASDLCPASFLDRSYEAR